MLYSGGCDSQPANIPLPCQIGSPAKLLAAPGCLSMLRGACHQFGCVECSCSVNPCNHKVSDNTEIEGGISNVYRTNFMPCTLKAREGEEGGGNIYTQPI